MGEYLYYQITTYLIDAISKGSPRMHAIHIIADIDKEELPCAGKVGTGISCGIDSMHVLACQSNSSMIKHNVTHLAFNNVGSHGEGVRAKLLYAQRRKAAEAFCNEYGYELTEVNSNIMDEFEQNHFLTHLYTSAFAIFVLQKLYSIYYYASSGNILEFSLRDNDLYPCGHYEMLAMDAFSTDKLKLYSEGETLSRLEKTRKVVNYAPSYKYLNVCLNTAVNCGKCEKCIRTLLALDALNALDKYTEVFDVDYYKQHKSYALKILWANRILGDKPYYKELYPYFKSQIKLTTKIQAIPMICIEYIKKYFPKGKMRNVLKRKYSKYIQV